MRHGGWIAGLGLMLLGTGQAWAEQDCAALDTQAEMNTCAGENYKAADAMLGKAWKALVGRLGDDADTLAMLRTSERAWIAYRDAECAFASSAVAGGSIEPMIRAECLQAATIARTAILDGYLSCEEGDLSCPVPPE